jgi:hypothetical protein
VIVENRRACIVVINKWDLMEEAVRVAREEEIGRRRRKERVGEGGEKTMTTLGEFGAWVQEKLFFLDYAPVIFTSARSGFNLDRLLEAVRYVAAQLQQQIPTAILNRTLRDAVELLCHPGAAGAAHVPAVREPRRIVFRPVQEVPRGRTPPRVWLRRLSAGAGAQGAAENHRAGAEVQAQGRGAFRKTVRLTIAPRLPPLSRLGREQALPVRSGRLLFRCNPLRHRRTADERDAKWHCGDATYPLSKTADGFNVI